MCVDLIRVEGRSCFTVTAGPVRHGRVTAEYRQTLVAQAKEAAERAKIRVRDQRNKTVKQLRGLKASVSEDDLRRQETEVRVGRHC